MGAACPLLLGLLLLSSPPARAQEAEPPSAGTAVRTLDDPLSTFSITFPGGWRSEPLADGDWSQIGLFAENPYDISIVVASRPRTPDEAELDSTDLLDRLIESTMINVAALGNQIIQVGRVDPLVDEWPAFAAVATNGDRSKMITILRSVARDRIYVLTTLTDNLQGSPELGAVVGRVVASFEVLVP